MPAWLTCSTDDSTEPQGLARGLPAALMAATTYHP